MPGTRRAPRLRGPSPSGGRCALARRLAAPCRLAARRRRLLAARAGGLPRRALAARSATCAGGTSCRGGLAPRGCPAARPGGADLLHAFVLGLFLYGLDRQRLSLLGRLLWGSAEWITLHEPSYSGICRTTWPVCLSLPWRATSACATTATSWPSFARSIDATSWTG